MLALLSFVLAQQMTVAQPMNGGDPAAYQQQIETWRAQRLARLKADGGWLTLAGLFWLKPGRNGFGADPSNEIVLPAHRAPPRAGVFRLDAGRVTVEVLAGVPVTVAGKPITRATL